MPHPVYGPPDHVLERLEFKLYLPTRRNGRHAQLTAHGFSETKRGSLWTVQERWSGEEQRVGLQPCDALHHLALASWQDRPITQTGVELALTGQSWEQLELDL